LQEVTMQKQKQSLRVTNVEVRIGICAALCKLLTMLIPSIQLLAALTGTLMCTQMNSKVTVKSTVNRLEGVLAGGVVAVLVLLCVDALPEGVRDYIFALLAGAGCVLTLFCCKLIKLPDIAGRVSCITFILTIVMGPMTSGPKYVIARFLGTLAGGLIAIAVAYVNDLIFKKEKQTSQS